MISEKRRRIFAILIPILVLVFYAIFLTHKINLVTADLGRHITNGKALFEDAKVLTTNFYSYTNADFPALNHHWGSGVVFFAVWKLFGLAGTEALFILVSLATLAIFYYLAKEKVGAGLAGLISLACVLVLAERTEVRPETFSYLFAAIFVLVLSRFRDHSDNPRFVKLLYLLPAIQILWTNLHIYFILGPIIVGTFLVESVFQQRRIFRKLCVILALAVLATLASPFGFSGLVEVFTIFHNYGYTLVENQPVWFLENMFGARPDYILFQLVFGLAVLSFLVPLLERRWRRIEVSSFLFLVGFGGMAWFAIRNFALFGFFAIGIIASNLVFFCKKLSEQEKNFLDAFAAAFLVAAICLALFGGLTKYFPYWSEGGVGLEAGNSAAADFWKREDLRGPIFNDYDDGGYLIYHLYPKEKVFVDNRPEAYPTDFFQRTYIPMQQDDAVWKAAEAKYKFNAIFFSRTDATPWARQFLAARAVDPEWAPVFLDNKLAIFLKHTEVNAALIKKFGITLSP